MKHNSMDGCCLLEKKLKKYDKTVYNSALEIKIWNYNIEFK